MPGDSVYGRASEACGCPPSAAQRTLRPKLGSGLVGETAGLGVVDGVEVAIVVDNFVDVLMAGGEGVSF